ncbi:Ala-tRNA(Pro) hydrolase [Rhodobacteraceae bacterium WD3A24]|nr:Ala-tRNA(Pro) hydrolase [Rhodobacteraceae bacterium WD3A24]
MSEPLYRTDPYAREAHTRVTAVTEQGGIIPGAALFYPTGGGQPGDSGWLDWPGGSLEIATTVRDDDGAVVLIPAEGQTARPAPGDAVTLRLDWGRRYSHMRVHTALHLLSVVIPLPVTGGQIGAGKGRLDFDMPEAPGDKAELEAALNALVARDLPVSEDWISDAELAANPELVKTMSVKPPMGAGQVRLVRIGAPGDEVDLQPCGGTHVAATGEIGEVRLGKIEKKGRQNRRVSVILQD